jgi:protein O-GlcNAc transferase
LNLNFSKKAGRVILIASVFSTIGSAGDNFTKANELYQNGQLKESVALYKKAIVDGDNPTLCYFNCANAYFQIDSLPQALLYYKACINTAPDFIKGYLNLAIAYYMLEDLGPCIATARRTLQLDPENQKMHLVLAAAYQKAGAIPEAVVEYEFLIQKYPELEEPYLALGEIYRTFKDFHGAIQWLGDYLQLLIADLYDQIGEPERAIFYLQKSFELDKKNKWTFYKIIILHEKMGNDFVALETAMEGMSFFPDFSELALEAGNIAFKRKRYSEAEYCYAKAQSLGSPGAITGLENLKIIQKQNAMNRLSSAEPSDPTANQ